MNKLYLLLTLAFLFTVFWTLQFLKRLNMKAPVAMLLSLLHVVYGVLCVRLFAALEGAPGGMSLFGAVFFMPLAYFVAAKWSGRPMRDVFDIFAICMIFTLLCARCNCLLSGCCLGLPIREGSALRWPTREAEIVYYLLFLGYFIPRVYQNKTHGEVYPFYMFSYGALRFVLEFFRVAATDNLFHISHVWAFLSAGIGYGIYRFLKKKQKIHRSN